MIAGWLAAFFLLALVSGWHVAALPLAPTATPVFPNFEAETFHLAPNFGYSVSIITSVYRPNTISMHSRVLDEDGVSFALHSATEPNHFTLALPEAGWGMAYVVYALNVQAEDWTVRYDEVGTSLMLSPDGQTLALFMCKISGGRGQWCDQPHLWFFSRIGEPHHAELADYGVLYFTNMHFSEDSRQLRAETCLKYRYPGYFGICGVNAVTTWDVSTGDLFALSVIPAR